MAKIPRLRTRLIALAIGVALVVGATVLVVRSNLRSEVPDGLGGWVMKCLIGRLPASGLAEVRPGVMVVTSTRAHLAAFERDANNILDQLEYVAGQLKRMNGGYDQVWMVQECTRTGVWGPTREREKFYVGPWDSTYRSVGVRAYSDESRAREVDLLRKHLASAPGHDANMTMLDTMLLGNGRHERSRTLWSGYFINAATIIGLGLMGWGSLGTFTALRAWRRIAKHQCVHCAYDLRGLAETRCPECGVERIVRNAGEVSPAPPQ